MYELECATKGLAKLNIITRCTKFISWIACQVIGRRRVDFSCFYSSICIDGLMESY